MKKFLSVATCVAALLAVVPAWADVPNTMTYHGSLSDAAGQPVDTTVEASFSIYDASTGGNAVWSENFSTIDVNAGAFSVELGAQASLADVLDGSKYWLEIEIEGETLTPRTPIASVPYALRAARANDADTVGGKSATEIEQAAPSSAAQISYDNTTSGMGATDVQTALDHLATLEARIAALESALQDSNGATVDVASSLADLDSRVTSNTDAVNSAQTDITTHAATLASLQSDVATKAAQSDLDALTGRVAINETAVASNASDIADLQAAGQAGFNAITTNATAIASLEALTQDMSRTTINGKTSIVFEGVNLHVRSGSGSTTGTLNGLGNLVVGYDEARSTGSNKSGSHNLVVGGFHNYSSYSGVVFGYWNESLAPWAAVIAGAYNKATGTGSAVTGGANNTASEYYSAVTGGRGNKASATGASVTGGSDNTASGMDASVGGGNTNTASGLYSAVNGGYYNNASGYRAAISGGWYNVASGTSSAVNGGYSNEATEDSATVGGGYNVTESSPYYWAGGTLRSY